MMYGMKCGSCSRFLRLRLAASQILSSNLLRKLGWDFVTRYRSNDNLFQRSKVHTDSVSGTIKARQSRSGVNIICRKRIYNQTLSTVGERPIMYLVLE